MLRVCQQVASRGQYLDRTLLLLVTWASDLPLHTITVNAVLLSLQNVEASCHKHFVVISCEQQTKPFTSDECHQLATVWHSCVYYTWRWNRRRHAMKTYWLRIAIFA